MNNRDPIQRKSYRLVEVAERNALSVGFLYKESAAGRLRIRKAGGASIVTDKDEADWLAAMPLLDTPNSP